MTVLKLALLRSLLLLLLPRHPRRAALSKNERGLARGRAVDGVIFFPCMAGERAGYPHVNRRRCDG